MKNLFFVLVLLVAAVFNVAAQTANAVLFTENGERFTVILNGVRQNQRAETNVKLPNLTAEVYKMRIIFEDKRLGVMDNTLYVNFGEETTYAIRKKKSKYVLRFISSSPLNMPVTQQQNPVIINQNTNGFQGGIHQTPPPRPNPNGGTTTTTTTNGNGVAVNGQISVGGVTVGGQVNTGNSSTTTTTGGGYIPPQHQQPPYVLPGYTGVYGCPYPMQQNAFSAAKNSIMRQAFEDSKLTVAKQVINSNCLLTSQVREIVQLFAFEESKLDFAKYAYGYTLDINNYFTINDVFHFSSSVDELNQYIGSYRR
jgi:hypothetical protein